MLEITARTAGNRVIADPMEDVIDKVRQGSPIAPPMAKAGVCPGMMTQMVAVGEETGALDRMLMKLADFYEDEVESSLKAITSIIEPIMMIFVGAIVGVVVLAMYLPLFKIFDAVGASRRTHVSRCSRNPHQCPEETDIARILVGSNQYRSIRSRPRRILIHKGAIERLC